ncbi:hypothetical protein ALC53_07629, partial [Atta colombica]
AIEKYVVSKNTLYCNIKIIKQGDEINLYSKSRCKKTFDEFHELLLKEYVANLSNKCMSLTKKKFLELAVLAELLKINHRFNKEKKLSSVHKQQKVLSVTDIWQVKNFTSAKHQDDWMNGEPFIKWVQYFIKFSKPTATYKLQPLNRVFYL